MSTPEAAKPARSWQEIAKDASHETEPKKLAALVQELVHAIDERDRRLAEVAKGEAA